MKDYITLQTGQKFTMGVSRRMGFKKYQKGVKLNGAQVAGNFTAETGDTLEFPDGGWAYTAGYYPNFGAVTLRVLSPLSITGGKDGWDTQAGRFELVEGFGRIHPSDLLA